MVRTSTSSVLAVSCFSYSDGRSASFNPPLMWQDLVVFDLLLVWVDLNGDMLIHNAPYNLPRINLYEAHAAAVHSPLMLVSIKT